MSQLKVAVLANGVYLRLNKLPQITVSVTTVTLSRNRIHVNLFL